MAKRSQGSIAYHAARLLILIQNCGKPRASASLLPGIAGRTLLAKLDFFLRYPGYLKRARGILRKGDLQDSELLSSPEAASIESRMIRYFYGPWDHIYYSTLAYLIGKSLLKVDSRRQIEVFRLTPKGLEVAEQLSASEAYIDLAERAQVVNALFHGYTGNGVKTFIYEHFPEVVGRKLGQVI